jgi:hypothetical protein
VAYQSQQRQRGGLDGPAGQGGGVEAGALQLERDTLAAQELDQCGALVAERRTVLPWVVFRVDEHVGFSWAHRHIIGDSRESPPAIIVRQRLFSLLDQRPVVMFTSAGKNAGPGLHRVARA